MLFLRVRALPLAVALIVQIAVFLFCSKRKLLYPLVAGINRAGEVLWRRHIKRLAMTSFTVVVAGMAALRRAFPPPLSPLD